MPDRHTARTPRRTPTRCWLWLLAVALSATAVYADKNTYRWRDEQGRIHYSDRVPPEHSRHGRQLLDDQGKVLEQVEPAKTPAQRAADQRRAKQAAERARLARRQARKDRILLNTFENEAALIKARDDKIAAIDSQIAVSQNTLAGLKGRLNSLQETAAERERTGKNVSADLTARLAQVRQRIKRAQQYIAQKEAEQHQVRERYESDILRYRQLRDGTSGVPTAQAAAGARGSNTTIGQAVSSPRAGEQICQRATANLRRHLPSLVRMIDQKTQQSTGAERRRGQGFARKMRQELAKSPATLTRECLADWRKDDARQQITCVANASGFIPFAMCFKP